MKIFDKFSLSDSELEALELDWKFCRIFEKTYISTLMMYCI